MANEKLDIIVSKAKELADKGYDYFKKASYDTGVFTLSLIKKLPSIFVLILLFLKSVALKIAYVSKKLLLKLAHPFCAMANKIARAFKALRVKSVAAYKEGGFGPMFKASVGVFSDGFKRNYSAVIKIRNYLLPIGGAAVLFLTIFALSRLTFGLVVEYDGVVLGNIQNEAIYSTAEKQLKQRIINEKNEDVEIIPQFTLAVVDKDSFLTSDQITDKLIIASSSVIEEASGLYVDNVLLGAVTDGDALDKTLDSILAKYSGEEGDIVSFVKDVQIKQGLYPSSSIVDIEEIKKLITADVSSEIIYTVAKGDTPYEVARKSGITLSTLYSLNPIAKTTFVIGQKITIASSEPFLSVKVQRNEVVRESVDYQTITTKNNNYYSNYRKVTRAGSKGINDVTYLVTYLNGVVTDREIVETVVVREPVDEKVTVGTKVQSTGSSISASTGTGSIGRKFIWPTSGKISCRWWGYYNHRGLDIAAPKGTPIYAAAAGTVISYKNLSYGYGRHIVIDHGNGVQTLYAHTSAVYVKVGQKVSQGQHIAAIGSTGYSTGNHLHFGVMINGVYKNPELYLP